MEETRGKVPQRIDMPVLLNVTSPGGSPKRSSLPKSPAAAFASSPACPAAFAPAYEAGTKVEYDSKTLECWVDQESAPLAEDVHDTIKKVSCVRL
jgi:hypothetical protein